VHNKGQPKNKISRRTTSKLKIDKIQRKEQNPQPVGNDGRTVTFATQPATPAPTPLHTTLPTQPPPPTTATGWTVRTPQTGRPLPTVRPLALPPVNPVPPGNPAPPTIVPTVPTTPTVTQTTTPTATQTTTPTATQPGTPQPKQIKSRPGGGRFLNTAATGAVPLSNLHLNVPTWLSLQAAVKPAHQARMRLIVDTLVLQGEGPMALPDLAARINKIGDLCDRILANQPVTASLDADAQTALNLAGRLRKLDELGGLINTNRAESVPLNQLTELTTYLTDNPTLTAYLRSRNIGIAFDSGYAKLQGGGVFHDGDVHLFGLEALDADVFLRLLVHEAGHGTYQRLLLPEKHLPLDAFWDQGKAADQFDQIDAIRDWAAAEGVPPEASTRAKEYQDLLAKFSAEKTSDVWDDLPEDGKLLYRAWAVIRRYGSQYFQGIDMGPGKPAGERSKYQADYFTEFCAESFMLVASGDIDDHYDRMWNDPTVPDEVRGAWKTAKVVLDEYAKRRVLGR
jgi:hypothetical protein